MRFNAHIALEIAEAILAGEDWSDWLLACEEQLIADYEGLAAQIMDTDYYDRSPQEVECGLSGLEQYRESLLLLQEGHLEQAVQVAAEAQRLMDRALEANAQVHRAPVLDLVAC